MLWFRKVCIFLLVACLMLLLMYLDAQKSADAPVPVHGNPSVYEEDMDTTQISMDQILDDNKHIYVLDQFEGIIRIYNLSGEYQFSWFFYDYLNGSFRMAVSNEYLYVCDPHNDVYIFLDGTFIDFIDRENAQELLSMNNFGEDSSRYEVRQGSIWHIADQTCLVEKPTYAVRVQRREAMLLALVLVAAIAIFKRHKLRKK